jgi:hypothetical protein
MFDRTAVEEFGDFRRALDMLIKGIEDSFHIFLQDRPEFRERASRCVIDQQKRKTAAAVKISAHLSSLLPGNLLSASFASDRRRLPAAPSTVKSPTPRPSR